MLVTERMRKMRLKHSTPADTSITAREPAKWVRLGARLGYLAKGAVYVLIAFLAARAAWIGGSASGPREVLWTVVEQPIGMVLLAGVAIGLSAYSLWRFTQCIADTEGCGRSFRGLCARAGYFGSGLVYGGLVLLAARILTGVAQRRQQPGDVYVREWTRALMQQPWGQWLVGTVGIGVIVFGLAQLYKTWTGIFRDEGDLSGMSARRRRRAVWFGRFGAAGRGVVFAIIGVWLIVAAKNADPADARGLGGALDTLALQPYGPWLLGAAAGGFFAYGLYQFTLAGYKPQVKRSCERPV